jgi:hypothetical protein
MALLFDRLVTVSKTIATVHLLAYFANNFDFIFLLILSAVDWLDFSKLTRCRFSYSYWKGNKIITERGQGRERIGVSVKGRVDVASKCQAKVEAYDWSSESLPIDQLNFSCYHGTLVTSKQLKECKRAFGSNVEWSRC